MVLEKKQLSKALAVLLTLAMMLCGASIVTLCTTAKAYAASTFNVQTAIPDQTWTGDVPDLMAEPALETIKVATSSGRTATLTRGVDFVVEADSSSVGTANALFTAMGDYAGDTINPKAFNIVEATAADTYEVTVDTSKFVYDGDRLRNSEVEAATTVMKNGIENIYRGDQDNQYTVTVSPRNTVNAGDKATVTITINALSGDAAKIYEEEVTILPFDLANATSITGTQQQAFVYDGTAKEATFGALTVGTIGTRTATLPVANYDITGYQDNVNATTDTAKAKAIVKAKATETNSNFTGEGVVEFEIGQFDLSGAYVQQAVKPSVVFNGERQEPAVSLAVATSNTYGAQTIPAEEYTVAYPAAPASINAGEYNVTVAPAKEDGNYKGSKVVAGAYQITQADLKDAIFTQTNAIEAGVTVAKANILDYFDVTVNGYKLKQADVNDMTVTPTGDNTKAGQTITVALAAPESTNFKGTGNTTYVTTAKALAPVYQAAATFEYTGSQQVPVASILGELTVKGGTATITTAEYDVTGNWQNNVNAGTATATIQGKGDYAGEAVVEFTITPKKLDPTAYTATVTGIPTGTYFEGAVLDSAVVSLTPAVSLTKDDYEVTAKTFDTDQSKLIAVDIALKGNYAWTSGTKTATVDVVSNVAQLKDAVITGTVPAGLTTYNAAAVKRYITVTVGNVEATAEAYNLTITNSSAADFGRVGTKIKFDLTSKVDQLIGEKTGCEVEVTPRNIAELQPAAIAAQDYTGAALTPTVTLSDPEGYAAATAAGTDFTVSYDKNKNAGTAEVTITGKGNYTGTTTTSFVISPVMLAPTDFVLVVPEDVDAQFRPAPKDESAKLSVKAATGKNYEFTADDYEITMVPSQTLTGKDQPIRYTLAIKASSNNYVANNYEVSYDSVERQVTSADADITIQNTQFEVGTTVNTAALGTVTVKVDGRALRSGYGRDYTIDFGGVTNRVTSEVPEADKPYVEFKFRNNYSGQVRVPIMIVQKVIDINEVKLTAPSAARSVYSGDPIPVTEVDSGKNHLVSGNATNHYYTVVYKTEAGEVLTGAPTEVGTYTATVVATEAYGGAEGNSITFQVKAKKLSKAEFNNMAAGVTVDGTVEYLGEGTPAPALTGTDSAQFEVVEWDKVWDGDAAKKGTATIALKEDANYVYAGTATTEFTWKAGKLAGDVNDYLEIADQVYTGKAIEPAVQVKKGSELSADWVEVKYYENNVNAAVKTAKAFVEITVPATETRYTGTLEGFVVFTINPAPIADQTITVAKATYAGKAVTPKVTIKDADGALLELDKDYTVAYADNTKAGMGTATITGIKNYTGTTDVQFTINKGTQKITKVTPAKKTYKANKKGKLAKKKTFKLKATVTPKKGGGKVTFKKANKVGGSKIKVAKSGKVTVKKGLAKGTYKVKVKATKAANANYKKATKTVTVQIVIK